MSDKKTILRAIAKLASILTDQDIDWIIGGSGSLLLHGVDLVPNDIDLIVNPADIEKTTLALKKHLVATRLESKTKISFKISGVPGEIVPYPIDNKLITTVDLFGEKVRVHNLQTEYKYYKKRAEKVTAAKNMVRLIEGVLNS